MVGSAGGAQPTPLQGIQMTVKVEEKLFQNRYRVDAGRPHIAIKLRASKRPP